MLQLKQLFAIITILAASANISADCSNGTCSRPNNKNTTVKKQQVQNTNRNKSRARAFKALKKTSCSRCKR